MYQKIIYILIRMNNNLNYNNGGGCCINIDVFVEFTQ